LISAHGKRCGLAKIPPNRTHRIASGNLSVFVSINSDLFFVAVLRVKTFYLIFVEL